MALFDFQRSGAAAALLPAVRLRFVGEASQQYYLLSNRPVAYSVQIEPFVVADYAGDGSVRGIEFLNQLNRTLEAYIGLAQQKSRGPLAHGLEFGNFGAAHGTLLPAVQSV